MINPDGSTFPSRLLNTSRPEIYHLQMQSDKKPHYVNLTSPVPGTYYAAAFLSWTDPTSVAITQQGLTAECYVYVDVTLYSTNASKVDIISQNQNVQIMVNSSRVVKFYVPEFVDHAVLMVKSLQFLDGDVLKVSVQARKLPNANENLLNFVLNDTGNNEPFYGKFWTLEENWHYIEFSGDHVNVTFHLQFFTSTEGSFLETYKNTSYFRTAVKKIPQRDRLSEISPYKQYNLVKISSTESFLYSYDLPTEIDTTVPVPINLTSSDFTVLKFEVQKDTDIGGSLQFSLAFSSKVRKNLNFEIIIGCVRRNVREIPTWPNKCSYDGTEHDAPLILNKTSTNSTVYIPYVEPGIWFGTFKLFNQTCTTCECAESCDKKYAACADVCERNCASDCEDCAVNCRKVVLQKEGCSGCDCSGNCQNSDEATNTSVLFDVSSYPCLAGKCGNGRCVYMVSGGFVYSTCICLNNYRGWDCSDASLANSYMTILIELLLLVLSNVAFVPATYVAYKREYYVEAIVYASLCFFSTFYHACDAGENIISFCLMKLGVLQFADFFTALLAIWVTLIAMADLPSFYPSIFRMFGSIFLAMATTADRHSLWVFIVPAVCGVSIIAIRWGWYYRQNRFLPINKKYLYMNLPSGALLVSIGLVVYAALQTNSNYKYTHSFWHVVMAVAVIILLPNRRTFGVRVLI